MDHTATPTPRVAGIPQGIAIIISAFLPIIAILALGPAIPRIIEHFGAGPRAGFLVPILVSAPGLAIALFSPAAGWLIDRFGRRVPLTIATFLYAAIGSVPLFAGDINLILVSRFALGITEAVIMTSVHTLLIDYFDPDRRRRWLTVQAITGPILATAVIAGSGMLTEKMWNGSFLIYVAIAVPVAVLMLFVVYEPVRALWAGERGAEVGATQAAAVATPFPWPAVLRFCAVTLFASTLYYVVVIQGALAFQAVGVTAPSQVGFLLAIASVGVPVGAVIYGALSKRPAALLIGLMLSFWAVGLAGVGFAKTAHVMAAMAFIQQIGAGMAVPSLLAWAQGQLPVKHRGRGMGLWTSAFFLGQFTSPLVVDLAKGVSQGRLQSAFLILGAIAATGLVVTVLLAQRRNAVLKPA
jgi:MFS family permease